MKDYLMTKIKELELKILIYSDRDRDRVATLEKQLAFYNMQLLNEMVK